MEIGNWPNLTKINCLTISVFRCHSISTSLLITALNRKITSLNSEHILSQSRSLWAPPFSWGPLGLLTTFYPKTFYPQYWEDLTGTQNIIHDLIGPKLCGGITSTYEVCKSIPQVSSSLLYCQVPS